MKRSSTPPLPELAEGAPGRNGFKYQERFGVIVVCRDEAEHQAVFEELTAQGFACKAVRT